MSVYSYLATVNAILNSLSLVFLILGFRYIKRGNRETHKRFMLSALITSALFFIVYAVYHAKVGSVPYPHHDWTRPLYYSILAPHVILAALNLPFIIWLVRLAFKGAFNRHKRLARIVWPVWVFVSASGIVVYLMLYHL